MFRPSRFDIAAYERDPQSFSSEFGAAVEHEKAVSLMGVNQDALTRLYQEIGLFFDSPDREKYGNYVRDPKSRRNIFQRYKPSQHDELSQFPALQESLSIVYENLNDIALVVVKALANYFENDKALQKFNERESGLHLQRYDPMSWFDTFFSSEKVRLKGHHHHFCTLLPPATVEGLEILTAPEKWEAVSPEEGSALFLPGEWADFPYGLEGLQAVEHRVVAPAREKRRLQRYVSIVEFL